MECMSTVGSASRIGENRRRIEGIIGILFFHYSGLGRGRGVQLGRGKVQGNL
jgi:hypothetical protein